MEDNGPTSSPLPMEVVVGELLIDFYSALKEVVNVKKVTRKEWNNLEIYGLLLEGRLSLHKDDGKFYDWIVSEGDMIATDWIVLP